MAHVLPAMRIPTHVVRVAPTVVRRADSASTAGSTGAANTSPAASSTGDASDAAADFRALFTSHSNLPPATTPAPYAPAMAPTAQSLFGANPWMTNPGFLAPNGATYGYNPYYFATAATAAKVAQMVGGTVMAANAMAPYGPFQQSQPNYMVQLPNGRQINAGLFASFYDHGYSQDFVDKLVASELNG